MSYLTLPNGIPNFSKAIISFWFRVPRETLEATAAAYQGKFQDVERQPFDGITPLVVFGDDSVAGNDILSGVVPGEDYIIEHWFRTDLDPDSDACSMFQSFPENNRPTNSYGPGFERPKNPCYIGIDCNKDKSEEPWDPREEEQLVPNVLRINIQLSDLAAGSGMAPYMSTNTGPPLVVSFDGTDVSMPVNRSGHEISYGPLTDGSFAAVIAEYNPVEIFRGFSDGSSIWLEGQTEWFKVKLRGVEVTPDQWHHVLVSFDLSGSVSASGMLDHSPDKGTITTSCSIWVAYDDVNYKGNDLLEGSYDNENIETPIGDNALFIGDNALFTESATWFARFNNNSPPPVIEYSIGGWVEKVTVDGPGLTRPTYHYTPSSISSANYAMGIPATSKYVDNVRNCEFAEFQMWTGKTLDTGVLAARRLFVDKDGKPVKPNSLLTQLLLGKPDILLHGTSKWKKGKNTGSLGMTTATEDSPSEEIPSGQFTPVGGIEAYKPDPSLHGPQNPPGTTAPLRLTKKVKA